MGDLGTNLKNARLKNGLTQKQLAEMIDAKHNSISNWENNQNKPDPDTLEIISGVLGVSVDYLLYGFDKTNFTLLVNLIRYKRSIKEFSKDTGIDEFYLNRLCSGVIYEQPSIEIVEKIADNNHNDWLVDRNSIFKAAGYDTPELTNRGPAPSPGEVFAAPKENNNTHNIAAHHDDDEWTEEELEEIERFKEFIRSKRKQNE